MQQRQESEIIQILKRLLFRPIPRILRPLSFYYSKQFRVSESIAKKAEGRKILGERVSKVSGVCKPDASGLSEETAQSPLSLWGGSDGATRGATRAPDTATAAQSLSAIPDPCPGTTDLDGTQKLKTHLERIKEILLLAWLRAASVHGRGNITMETWPRPDADVHPVLPSGSGCQSSQFLEMSLLGTSGNSFSFLFYFKQRLLFSWPRPDSTLKPKSTTPPLVTRPHVKSQRQPCPQEVWAQAHPSSMAAGREQGSPSPGPLPCPTFKHHVETVFSAAFMICTSPRQVNPACQKALTGKRLL